MIKFENHLGAIEISQDYFANLVGHAASECFGVAGMVESTASQGLRYILKKDEAQDKGVKVRTVAGGLVIDLHIAVTYGVNKKARAGGAVRLRQRRLSHEAGRRQEHCQQSTLHRRGGNRSSGGKGQRVC